MPDPAAKESALKEVALVFLKLGMTAFGGPAAHIAMMNDEIVNRRQWVTREAFMDLLGAANLIPGPNSTELAIHLGYKRAGWMGLLTAGICFITPAMLIVWFLAVLYQHYQTIPQLSYILYGIKPVIMAIVLQAIWSMGQTTLKSKPTGIAAVAVIVLVLRGWNELLLLFCSGLLIMLWSNRHRLSQTGNAALLPMPWLHLSNDVLPLTAASKAVPLSLSTLFFTFLKIGSVLYGSGYVLIAFLQTNFVAHFGALTSQELLDAVAVGQFTPGPVFTTATFVGYLIQGNAGAILATLGIFLPAFIFVALISPWSAKLRRSRWLSAMLDGINAASWGLMAAISLQLGRTALVDIWTCILALAAVILLLRFKINSAWLVLGGALSGLLIQMHS